MATTAQDSSVSLGLPVEIGEIDRALKKLWAQNEGAMTRASLINLAVYSEEADSLGRNTELISQLTEDHACRAIVIAANPNADQNRAEAWISAHCHISRAGSKQICSEQLSFSLQGPCTALLPNIVFSQLDSDLPFYLWWQATLREPVDAQLWSWVDRLIFDSQTWQDFEDQFRLIEMAQSESHHRLVLCDLNWTRLDRLRAAVAQFFDHPQAQRHLDELSSVRITHAEGFRRAAVLLAGWLGAQLGWTAEAPDNKAERLVFTKSNGEKVAITLREQSGPPVAEILLQTDELDFLVRHAQCGDLLEVSRSGRDETSLPQLLPAQSDDAVELLGQELLRGGPHNVYVRAVGCVRRLL